MKIVKIKKLKNIKYISIVFILSGFAVSGTRGALTQEQAIAQEVKENKPAAVSPDVLDTQTTKKVITNGNTALENKEVLENKEIVTGQVEQKVQEPAKESPESVTTTTNNVNYEPVTKSEVVFNDVVTTTTAEPISTSTSPTTTTTGQTQQSEVNQINQEATQQTFAEKAEQKAQEEVSHESVVLNGDSGEVTEEAMVFNPEEKSTEQNVIKSNAVKNQDEKINKEQAKISASKEILAEDEKNKEKNLEEEGLNRYYIEEDETESVNKPQGEQEIDFDSEEDSGHLIG